MATALIRSSPPTRSLETPEILVGALKWGLGRSNSSGRIQGRRAGSRRDAPGWRMGLKISVSARPELGGGPSGAARSPAQEPAPGGVADELSVAHGHLAAHRDDAGPPLDLPALERAVIDVHVLGLRRYDAPVARIKDD